MKPTDLVAYLSLLGLIVAGIGTVYYKLRESKDKEHQASKEQIEIYEGLNRALKEKVSDLETRLDEVLKTVNGLEQQIKQVNDNLKMYENLVVRSLHEYWQQHPTEAKAMMQSREFKKSKKQTMVVREP